MPLVTHFSSAWVGYGPGGAGDNRGKIISRTQRASLQPVGGGQEIFRAGG